jgi:putative transposase
MWTEEQRERYDYSGRRYASDLTDAEWQVVKPLLKDCVTWTVDLREMVNARLYLDWTGCQWRALPKDFGPYGTVVDWNRRFKRMGLWERISEALRGQARTALGRRAAPRTGLADSQSIKSSPQRGPRGTDGNKRVRGIKRHVITCSAGLLLAVLCTTAEVHDAKAAVPLIAGMPPHSLVRLVADSAYLGPSVAAAAGARGMAVEIVAKSKGATGFTPLPVRWRVEAAFGALTNFHRRLVRNWEQSLSAAANSLWVANARRTLRVATRKT